MYIHIALQKIRGRLWQRKLAKFKWIFISCKELLNSGLVYEVSMYYSAILYSFFSPMKYCSMLSKMSHLLNRMQLVWFTKKSTLSRLRFCIFKDRYNRHLPEYSVNSKLFQLLWDQVCLFFFFPSWVLCYRKRNFLTVYSDCANTQKSQVLNSLSLMAFQCSFSIHKFNQPLL